MSTSLFSLPSLAVIDNRSLPVPDTDFSLLLAVFQAESVLLHFWSARYATG
ncbi:hypothetical protein O3S68_15885 [Kosakonia sp. SOY2]|uniref:hypothetical protein n=1 Tax=Kosakonia sp. SOY2 TaxID=3014557 RepID=UPI0022ABD090|nr:hypothetical protein [Kosakonia sp. SOY2]MCZ3383763.1 hypothetical protein [Kosakonia sp. SOY2]